MMLKYGGNSGHFQSQGVTLSGLHKTSQIVVQKVTYLLVAEICRNNWKQILDFGLSANLS